MVITLLQHIAKCRLLQKFYHHCIRDIPEIFAYNGWFSGSGYWVARQILRPTPVAMATKFGTKSAITRPI